MLHLDVEGTLVYRLPAAPRVWCRRDLSRHVPLDTQAAGLHRELQDLARRHAGASETGAIPVVIHADRRTPWRHVAALLRVLRRVPLASARARHGEARVHFSDVAFAVRRRDEDGGLGYGRVLAPTAATWRPPRWTEAEWKAHTARWLRLTVDGFEADAPGAAHETTWHVPGPAGDLALGLPVGLADGGPPGLDRERALARLVAAVRVRVRAHREERGRYPMVVLDLGRHDTEVRHGDVVRVLHALEEAGLPPLGVAWEGPRDGR